MALKKSCDFIFTKASYLFILYNYPNLPPYLLVFAEVSTSQMGEAIVAAEDRAARTEGLPAPTVKEHSL